MESALSLFVWSKNRIVPVRITDFSITEEAFDPVLNPIRAKVSLGMRVLSVDDLGFQHKGGSLVHELSAEQRAIGGQSCRRQLHDSWHRRHPMIDPIQAFLEANALQDAAVSAEQPLLRHRQRPPCRRPDGTDGGLSQAPLLARSRMTLRCCKSIASAPATASIIWRPAVPRRCRAILAAVRRQRRDASRRS